MAYLDQILLTCLGGTIVFCLLYAVWRLRNFVVSKLRKYTPYKQRKRLLLYTSALSGLTAAIVIVTFCFEMTRLWAPDIYVGVKSMVPRGTGVVFKHLFVASIFIAMWEFSNWAAHRLIKDKTDVKNQRVNTLMPPILSVLAMLFGLAYALFLLKDIGVDIMPLLTGAGIAGLAVGLGAQQSIRDIIAGFTIILEDIVQIGDVIKIGQHGGVVEKVSLRKIQLRDFNGAVYTIPYSEVKIIENLTKDFSYYVFNLNIALETDIDLAIATIRKIGADLQQDPAFAPNIIEPVEISGVDGFGTTYLTIKARIKTLPIKQWEVGREFNKRLKYEFDRAGIQMAIPDRVIYPQPPQRQAANNDAHTAATYDRASAGNAAITLK